MGLARVLLIGRIQANRASVVDMIEKHYQVLVATSGKLALAIAREQSPQVVVLDAVSMRTPGDRICQVLREALIGIPIVHLHPGPKESVQSLADVVLIQPFKPRKLLNAIAGLIEVRDDEIITCGSFSVNLTRRVLNVHGQETQLTPKQALLMELFLRRPGETLARKILMEKVWQTDYLGDTRTLDVHVRWIREAIEDNPSKPRYLLTVRGVGYRLEVPPEDTLPEIEEPDLVLHPVSG